MPRIRSQTPPTVSAKAASVVPGKIDIAAVQLASRSQFDRLITAGVKIYEYPQMTHAKVAVRDGEWATVGSANLDSISMNHDYEFNFQSKSAPLVKNITDMILKDAEGSHQVKLGETKGVKKLLGKALSTPLAGYFL